MEPILLDKEILWGSLGLDPRLERAITKLGWNRPTLVQAKAIPLALQGKDILARARTGSGKTGAYAIPILQRLVVEKEAGVSPNGVKALILVPTRELCEQVLTVFTQLTHYLSNTITILRLTNDQPLPIQRARLAESPDILIATPGRLVEHLNKGHVVLAKSLQMVVIDEADLILSYGCQNDVETIARHLPKICQGFLMSATLNPEIENLKRLVLHTPAILRLEERTSDSRLQQYVVHCDERDKFLLIYVMLKLRLISGKIIIFVNDINQAFRLKLFLERFSIKSAVLNSELPQNSRYHIVQQFNKGIFDLLIATDENQSEENDDTGEEEKSSSKQEQTEGDDKQMSTEEEDNTDSIKSNESDESNDSNDEEGNESAAKETEAQSTSQNTTEDNDDNSEQNENENESLKENQHGGDPNESNDSSELSDNDTAVTKDSDIHSDIERDNNNDNNNENDQTINQKNQTVNDSKEQNSEKDQSQSQQQEEHDSQKKKRKKRKKKNIADYKDLEYGVTRGVDFQAVNVVVNFDFPRTLRDYIHRIGRTARAGRSGVALSFVVEKEKPLLKEIEEHQTVEGKKIIPYEFKMSVVEGFRYRVDNILRSVTRQDIKEARFEDIRVEILNSDRLKAHFEENPKDLETLQHTKPLQSSRILTHLKYIPQYLLPNKDKTERVAPQITSGSQQSANKRKAHQRKKNKKSRNDPLKSFTVSKKKGKKRKFTETMLDNDTSMITQTSSSSTKKRRRDSNKRPVVKRRRFASRRKKRNRP
jgi:ATP-dependent RNA helicase DDX56/DBP9